MINCDKAELIIDEPTEEYFLDLFEEQEDEVIQAIAKTIRLYIAEGEKVKFGWLDKQIHKMTGLPYTEIWQGFKRATVLMKKGYAS